MLTPTDLTEIERKARAYQAEEAANTDAKTCHRPTPELVLRLVDACRELHSKVRLYEETVVVANGKLIAERDDLLAKADQLREHNAGMGVELLGKDDTIKELRAKVAELEEKIKSSGVQSAMDAGMHTDEKGTVWTAPTAWSYAMACKARDNHQQSAYEANVKSLELQAIVDRLHAWHKSLPEQSHAKEFALIVDAAAQAQPKQAPPATGNESKEWVWVDGAQAQKGGA